ncbi:isochorismatase family protein [Sphingomonas yunnanensis]|uniref:cysteine hydrolase family protein n=1 Tax=Sphingomonas yunnanensis TaxID=310400 RepID=UPI001CA724ED|nr:isochorismatase family protein [Sphingomonas yunnanensis]MBY9062437.1 isochorismatase family protein [Sphingomonas yunnanensis]
MRRTLLVIDVQNAYFARGALPLWRAEAVEERIVAAIAAAQAAGDQIVLVRHVAAGGPFAEDEPGSVIRPAIMAVAEGAAVITKSYPDAFQETDLGAHLLDTGELFLCGMMTQNCVTYTALAPEATVLDRRVIGDLCTAPTDFVHQVALAALGSKIPVVTAAEVWPTREG